MSVKVMQQDEDSSQSSRTPKGCFLMLNLFKHERVATTVLRSCREDLGRAVPRMATW